MKFYLWTVVNRMPQRFKPLGVITYPKFYIFFNRAETNIRFIHIFAQLQKYSNTKEVFRYIMNDISTLFLVHFTNLKVIRWITFMYFRHFYSKLACSNSNYLSTKLPYVLTLFGKFVTTWDLIIAVWSDTINWKMGVST